MSYTTKTIWLDTPELTVTAFGNGASFDVTFRGSGKSVFFQGDAAATIVELFNALDELDSFPAVNRAAYIALADYEDLAR